MKNNTFLIILALLVLVAAFYFTGRLSTKKERDLSKQNIIALIDSVRTYKVVVNGLEKEVFEKKALVLSLNDAVELGLIEKEYWKKLHMSTLVANISLKGQLKAAQDSLAAVPGTQFVVVKDTIGLSQNYVKLPFTLLRINTKNINLTAGMDSNKKAWYSLNVPVEGTVTVGYKGNTAVGVFVSDNPLVDIRHMNVIVSPRKSKWYEKWFLSGTIGFVGGLILGTTIKK